MSALELKPDNRVDNRVYRRTVDGQKEAEFWCHFCREWRIFREVLYRQVTRLGRTSLTECTVCYADNVDTDPGQAVSIFRSRRGDNNVNRKFLHERLVAEHITRRRHAQQTSSRPLAKCSVSALAWPRLPRTGPDDMQNLGFEMKDAGCEMFSAGCEMQHLG